MRLLGKRHQLRMKSDNDYRARVCEKLKDRKTFLGKKHSEETKRKMRDSSKGKGIGKTNSQFGTRWINNGVTCKKIKTTEQLPIGWQLGRK
jgi:hypothetical protein